MLHIADFGSPVPTLAATRWPRALVPFVCAASLHVAAAVVIVSVSPHSPSPLLVAERPPVIVNTDEIRQFVFIARDTNPSGGGGGGGNRQAGPIRHAQGVGSDSITLRVAKPASPAGTTTNTAVRRVRRA